MLSAAGDYTFGQSQANFYVNKALGVGQNAKTRLKLFEGEWFLNRNDGTPWRQNVFGVRSNPTYDMVIQARILTTFGVEKIVSYSSFLNSTIRKLSVRCQILTIYSSQPVPVEVDL